MTDERLNDACPTCIHASVCIMHDNIITAMAAWQRRAPYTSYNRVVDAIGIALKATCPSYDNGTCDDCNRIPKP